MIAAIGLLSGVVAGRTYKGTMNTPRFLAWLDDELSPRLQPGMVIVMGNLRFHLAAEVRVVTKSAGCHLL